MKRTPSKVILSVIAAVIVVIFSLLTEGPSGNYDNESDSNSEYEQPAADDNEPATIEIENGALEMPELSGSNSYNDNSGKNIYIKYNGYSVSYNSRTKIPNWVAYELTKDEAYGKASRSELFFKPDNSLHCPQAEDYDYRNSGWSRGHMAPAGDFRWNEEAISDTFYFTNCCPQDTELNGGMWNTLEKKTRTLAKKYGKVWVVTGPVIGKNRYGTIGKNGVTVPDAFFKALLVKKGGTYHAIAFIMENRALSTNMQSCAMSVNEAEKITNLNLFASLDNSIEENIEERYTLSIWNL